MPSRYGVEPRTGSRNGAELHDLQRRVVAAAAATTQEDAPVPHALVHADTLDRARRPLEVPRRCHHAALTPHGRMAR